MMYVRRDKLVPDLPLVHYGGLEFGADFIVKDLEIDVVPTIGEAAHDRVVGGQLVFVGPVDIRGAEDCIAAAVEGDGDVQVATASLDGESASVVSVELGKREIRDVELVGGGQCGGLVSGVFWFISGWCVRRGKWCKAVCRSGHGLGGAYTLARLLEVVFDGSVRGGAVLHSVTKGEAWKGLVVACLDCGKPGGRDWVTGGSLVEMDERADAGKVIRAGSLGG